MRYLKLILAFLVLNSFLYASEDVPTQAEVAELYVATFNRAPDSAGLDYWINTSGLKLSGIAQSFFDSSETQELYPPSTSNTDFITSVYGNLFNRAPDADGLTYWDGQLNDGLISKNRFIQAVINGALDSDTAQDATILNNKKVVGIHFADQGLGVEDGATSIMSGVTADVSSVLVAKSTINSIGNVLVSTPTGTLVDPYIEGATLCEDLNNNSSCDDGEQISTATTSEGKFTFSEPLTPGTDVIINVQGTHVGKTYDLDISAVVASDGSVEIVSPLTSLGSKELTSEQIAAILNHAAQTAGLTNWNVSASDVSGNPISNDLSNKHASDITDEDLVKMQASLATYGLLRIIKGSKKLSELTANELYVSGMALDQDGAVSDILSSMLKGISGALNKDLLVVIKDTISQAKTQAQSSADTIANEAALSQITAQVKAAMSAIPGVTTAMIDAQIASEMAKQGSYDLGTSFLNEPTVEDIINVAVVIIDRISEVGYSTCNSTGGDYAAAISAANALFSTVVTQDNVMSIGTKLYGMKNASSLSQYKDYIPYDDVKTGINDSLAGKVTYRFDSTNTLVAQ